MLSAWSIDSLINEVVIVLGVLCVYRRFLTPNEPSFSKMNDEGDDLLQELL